jgi:hypothetical protein
MRRKEKKGIPEIHTRVLMEGWRGFLRGLAKECSAQREFFPSLR